MESIARTNLLAYINLGYDVLEFPVAKHTHVDMLYGEYLTCWVEQWRKNPLE
jgi:hypothetical protein